MFIGALIIVIGTCIQAPSTSLGQFMAGVYTLILAKLQVIPVDSFNVEKADSSWALVSLFPLLLAQHMHLRWHTLLSVAQ